MDVAGQDDLPKRRDRAIGVQPPAVQPFVQQHLVSRGGDVHQPLACGIGLRAQLVRDRGLGRLVGVPGQRPVQQTVVQEVQRLQVA